MNMKISIIIAFYNSHGAVARQVKYFKAMNLSDDIEFIFVDDGSNPPHKIEDYDLKNLRIHATNDKRAWTQGLARNAGAMLSTGEYLLMTDMDHIISREAIDDVYKFNGDKMVFKRAFGVLLPDGKLSQDREVLKEYGLDIARFKSRRGLYISKHGNSFAMKKSIFEKIGGYNPRRCTYEYYAGHRRTEDCFFNTAWKKHVSLSGYKEEIGGTLYLFPIARYHVNGEFNPMGLFHNLSHDPVQHHDDFCLTFYVNQNILNRSFEEFFIATWD